MELSEKAKKNLSTILSLEEDDTLIANRGTLSKQEEFVQLDNTLELEYAIYFTFHQLILSKENKETNKRLLFLRIDEAIYKLYGNKHLNQLISNDEEFCHVIEDIDSYISYLEDKHLFRSPLYRCNLYFQPILSYVYTLFEHMRRFSKITIEIMDEMNGMNDIFDDEEVDDDDSNDDSNDDGDEGDEGNVLKNQECDEVLNIEDDDENKSKLE